MNTTPLFFRTSLMPETNHALFRLTIGDGFSLHSAGEQLRNQGWTFADVPIVSEAEPTGDGYWQCGHRVFEVVPFVPERECSLCHGTGSISDGYESMRCGACEGD